MRAPRVASTPVSLNRVSGPTRLRQSPTAPFVSFPARPRRQFPRSCLRREHPRTSHRRHVDGPCAARAVWRWRSTHTTSPKEPSRLCYHHARARARRPGATRASRGGGDRALSNWPSAMALSGLSGKERGGGAKERRPLRAGLSRGPRLLRGCRHGMRMAMAPECVTGRPACLAGGSNTRYLRKERREGGGGHTRACKQVQVGHGGVHPGCGTRDRSA